MSRDERHGYDERGRPGRSHRRWRNHIKAMRDRARRLEDREAAEAGLHGSDCGEALAGATVDPGWRTPTVLAIARHIRSSRDGSALPVLADALEEAGCGDQNILTHCRDDTGRATGCWIVNLLLKGTRRAGS
jgi:hypothetical protein